MLHLSSRHRLVRFCWLIVVGVFLVVILSRPALSTSIEIEQVHQLNAAGFSLHRRGHFQDALKTWEQAMEQYNALDYPEGVLGSQINQSLALVSLGLNPRACTLLTTSLELSESLCSLNASDPVEIVWGEPAYPSIYLIGLRCLGDVLRNMGKLDWSVAVLTKAESLGASLADAAELERVVLSLGNTQTQILRQFLQTYVQGESDLRQDSFDQILNASARASARYAQLMSGKNETAIQARVNALRLASEFEQWRLDYASAVPEFAERAQALIAAVSPHSTSLPSDLERLSAIDRVYARLNVSASWLSHHASGVDAVPVASLIELSHRALIEAQALGNNRAQSYAYGVRAKILETVQPESLEVRSDYEQALALARSVQSWDAAYRWQSALARIDETQGNSEQAIQGYKQALNYLDLIRSDLAPLDPDLQFSFLQQIEPIYRRYMSLLLLQPQPDLNEIIRTNEQLQLTRLENFLQCGRLQTISLTDITPQPDRPAIVHLIELSDVLGIIIQSPDQSVHYYKTSLQPVQQAANNLIVNLQAPNLLDVDPTVFLPYANQLYTQLIAPGRVAGFLPDEGTLVFLSAPFLQNVPMGMLYDGERYLIEQYSISAVLGTQIQPPKLLSPDELQVLVAGVSTRSPSFDDPRAPEGIREIPQVESEVRVIERLSKRTEALLNEDFTLTQFRNRIRSGFPIIHLTTHGQFSSSPRRTVLLSWDAVIDAFAFDQLLQIPNQQEQTQIELLYLSACQTAKGNSRSLLGLAGISALSGARSTIGTLWLADAESAIVLTNEFYTGLVQELPKAEALRQAQIALIKSTAFNHPYYWGTYILSGSWL